jgi:hypothetical protein
MPERWWIPVLAAVVGLIGGVGGAYVGGEVANSGQKQQFENQRTAEVQDLLISLGQRLSTPVEMANTGSASNRRIEWATATIALLWPRRRLIRVYGAFR